MASVWNREKGFDDILQLRTILPQNELIVMVGLKPEQKKALPNGIIGIERTSNINELSMLYAGADVFINPTWGDNFPTVNIEALSCGTPVVTYKTGGSPEAIDNQSGIVIPQGNLEELRSAIINIKDNPTYYSIAHCRVRAVSHFNKLAKYQEYLNLYNTL